MAKAKAKIIIGWTPEVGIYELLDDGSITKSILDKSLGERVARFSFISRQIRWLQGEILTIAEATIDDKRKLLATKELIKDKFSAKISWIYELCGTPVEEQDHLDEPSATSPAGYEVSSTN